MPRPKPRKRYIRKSWHKPRGGRRAGKCKLTIPQVRYIRRVLAIEKKLRQVRGGKYRARGIYVRLGAKFGVSRCTIKDIARNATWKGIKAKAAKVEIVPSSSLARSSVHFLPDIRPRRGGSCSPSESAERKA